MNSHRWIFSSKAFGIVGRPTPISTRSVVVADSACPPAREPSTNASGDGGSGRTPLAEADRAEHRAAGVVHGGVGVRLAAADAAGSEGMAEGITPSRAAEDAAWVRGEGFLSVSQSYCS